MSLVNPVAPMNCSCFTDDKWEMQILHCEANDKAVRSSVQDNEYAHARLSNRSHGLNWPRGKL